MIVYPWVLLFKGHIPDVMRFAVKFAYDGRQFQGYARQPHQKTVEGVIIECLLNGGVFVDPKTARFRSGSRTDKGVSALGNVIAFNSNSSKEDISRCLQRVSSHILVYGFKGVDSDFFPRYARQRRYRYYLKQSTYDLDDILPVLGIFVGEHDFSNFARIEPLKNPTRTIDNIIVSKCRDYFVIDFFAQTFLWHQIRRIIAAVEKTGQGKLTTEQISQALHHPEQTVDFGIASPEPLLLQDIVYDFLFTYQPGWKAQLRMFEHHTPQFS